MGDILLICLLDQQFVVLQLAEFEDERKTGPRTACTFSDPATISRPSPSPSPSHPTKVPDALDYFTEPLQTPPGPEPALQKSSLPHAFLPTGPAGPASAAAKHIQVYLAAILLFLSFLLTAQLSFCHHPQWHLKHNN